MDFNTILVLVVDGGLSAFLLYAIYTTRQGQINYRETITTPPKPEKIQGASKTQKQPEPISSTSKPVQTPMPEPVIEMKTENVTPDTPSDALGRRIRVIDMEGIGPVYSKTLGDNGIHYIDEILEAGGTRKEREDLAEKTGISSLLIMDWVNMADLHRINNVAEEWSDLLEEADVNTVVELAQRVPEHLFAKLVEINESKNLVRRMPNQKQVEDWITQAKLLPRIVQY